MSDRPNHLRTLRQARGLRQCDLAERAAVSIPTVSRIEAGKSPGLHVTRRALATAVGSSEAEVFGGRVAA